MPRRRPAPPGGLGGGGGKRPRGEFRSCSNSRAERGAPPLALLQARDPPREAAQSPLLRLKGSLFAAFRSPPPPRASLPSPRHDGRAEAGSYGADPGSPLQALLLLLLLAAAGAPRPPERLLRFSPPARRGRATPGSLWPLPVSAAALRALL